MKHTCIQTPEGKALRECPTMEKPDGKNFSSSALFLYERELQAYNDYIETLKSYPISSEHEKYFTVGEVYVEGKDFEVANICLKCDIKSCPYYNIDSHCENIALFAIPLQKGKDEDKVCCIDCKKPYDDFGLDTVLSNEQWKVIHPDERGVLCSQCIINRAEKLGAIKVEIKIIL